MIIKEMLSDKISVIVPIYNVSLYLKKCVDSILCQTYENIEVVLVDDGSTDGSEFICDELLHVDGRIRVVHQNNRGLSGARNSGLELATGDFIGFVDPDDWIETTMYEEMLTAIKRTGANIAACGHCTIKSSSGDKRRSSRLAVYGTDTVIKGYEFYRKIWGHTNSVCNKLFNREIIGNHRFDEACRHIEDAVFWTGLITDQTAVVIVPTSLYNYYWARQGNISLSIGDDIFVFVEYTKMLYKYFSNKKMGDVGVRRVHRTALDIIRKIPPRELLSEKYSDYIKESIDLAKEPSVRDTLSYYLHPEYRVIWKIWFFLFRYFPYASLCIMKSIKCFI